MNCPYCDAKMTHVLESGSTKIPIYECGSHYDLQEFYRTDKCVENEKLNWENSFKYWKKYPFICQSCGGRWGWGSAKRVKKLVCPMCYGTSHETEPPKLLHRKVKND
jgi:hypothetical protein